MNETEFINEVRKELLAGYFPGENGRAERLEPEYVEELLQQKNWAGTNTLVHDSFVNRDQNKTDKFCIEGTANMLWTMDNC